MKALLDHQSLRLDEVLDDAVREALTAAQRPRRYGDGEMVFARGDEANEMYVVRSGGMRVVRNTADGRELTLAILGEGHYVGLEGMLSGTRGITCVATGPTEAGVITRSAFEEVLAAHPALAMQLLRVSRSRMKAALKLLSDAKYLPVVVQTAAIIEQILYASVEPGVVDWNQSDIALAVGTSRVSVGKALKELEQEGLLRIAYARIEVPDVERLSAWVESRREQLFPPA